MPPHDSTVIDDPVLEEKRMHSCLEWAIRLTILMRDKTSTIEDKAVLALSRQEITGVFSAQPLTDLRLRWIVMELRHSFEEAIAHGGFSICMSWDLAHHLHHIIYDEDLPPMLEN